MFKHFNRDNLNYSWWFCLILCIAILFATLIIAIVSPKSAQASMNDEHCLALNIYFESRGENLAGKFAVADVVLNRVRDNRWPNTVCGVITQSKTVPHWKTGKPLPIRNKCQFSWYCDGRSDIPDDINAWKESQIIAVQILHGDLFRGLTEGATHYHANYVSPKWKERFKLVGRIGDHIFYREE